MRTSIISLDALARECRFTFARSSGPGGQNVQKVNSKAVLRWKPSESACASSDALERFKYRYVHLISRSGEVVISSDRFRDQGRNKSDCINKLHKLLISVEKPPKPRKKTKPSRASKERRIESKKRHSGRKKERIKGRMSWE